MIVREVLLVGESEQITAILALAVRRVPDVDRAGWSTQVCGVANKRAKMAVSHPRTSLTPAAPRSIVWWTALVVGVAAVFAGATVLLPPRNEGNQDPALAMAVAAPTMIVGAIIHLFLAVTAVPAAGRRSAPAVTCVVIAATAAIAGAVFALLRRETLLGAGGAPAYVLWWVAAVSAFVSLCFLGIRISEFSSATRPPRSGDSGDSGEQARDVVASADRAADQLRYGAAERRAWREILARDAASASHAVQAQAERLGPFAYVAWAAYCGHVDAPELEEMIRRG